MCLHASIVAMVQMRKDSYLSAATLSFREWYRGDSMKLPVQPPVLPMIAKRVSELPDGSDWIFEPKWDGFRCLVFRDGDEVMLQSRDSKSLNRYFPELLGPVVDQLPE